MSTEVGWKGNRMEEIYRGLHPFELRNFPHISAGPNHKVLFKLPADENSTESLEPEIGELKWDSHHVKLPCAEQSEASIHGEVMLFPIIIEIYINKSNKNFNIFRKNKDGNSLKQLYLNQ